MRIRRCFRIIVLGVAVVPFLVTPTSWAAQSYTIQELTVTDSIKAVGPNLSGQAAVRSGFISAHSFRSTRGAQGQNQVQSQGAQEENIGKLPNGDHTTAHGINDAGTVVGSANTSFGSSMSS